MSNYSSLTSTDNFPYGVVIDNNNNLYTAIYDINNVAGKIQVTNLNTLATSYITTIEGINFNPQGLAYNSTTDTLYIANLINGDTTAIAGNQNKQPFSICSYNLTTQTQIFNFCINYDSGYLYDPFCLTVSNSQYLFITTAVSFNRICFLNLTTALTNNNNLTSNNKISSIGGTLSSYMCCNGNNLYVVNNTSNGESQISSYDITTVSSSMPYTILYSNIPTTIYGISYSNNNIIIANTNNILNYNIDTTDVTTLLNSSSINAISGLIINNNNNSTYYFASTGDTSGTIYYNTPIPTPTPTPTPTSTPTPTPTPTPDPSTPIICFKENTKILTNKGYLPIQDLRKGDLVKTLKNDYVPIDMIGKKEIYHPASEERIKDQLYKCSKEEYPEVFEDLVLTGCHCLLVDDFKSKEEKEKTIEVNGDIYITYKKYRLPACVDKKTKVYENEGKHTIYHFALENEDYYMNYGVLANGLLVETTSKRFMKELSGMELIE